MYTKADNPSGELIHYHQHPMTVQDEGFAWEQINTPKTVFAVAEQAQRSRPICTRDRTIVLGKYTPYHVFVDLSAEHKTKLLGDSATAPTPIAFFDSNNGRDELR